MNYATKELTASLQQLSSEASKQLKLDKRTSASLSNTRFIFSKEVEEFLDKTQDHARKSLNVHVGTY